MMSTATLARTATRGRVGPSADRTTRRGRGRRWAGLDGVRAIAVAGVVLYHSGVRWVPGGLLGVDVFFVLSGFLITSLLLREVGGGGRIHFGAFWARRARRLLPALILVLLAVMLWAALDPSLDLHSIRLDVASALGYVANWRFAFSHQGYFASSQAPSPVLHLWSLGVEEQFYLFWPILVAGVVGFCRLGQRLAHRRATEYQRTGGRPGIFLLAIAGAGGSTAWLIYGALHGTDSSRLYYGTDTRVLALLVGASLAAIMPLPQDRRAVRPSTRAAVTWTLLGLAALGGLLATFAIVGGQDRLLYRGGFLVFAVIVAIMIAALVRVPRGPLSRLLGVQPLAHIGRISYGIYLWHWPVILFLTAERVHVTGGALLALRIATAVTLAEVSYWLMERPILAGQVPSRRLAAAGVVSLVAIAGVAGPWSAVPRNATGDQGSTFASKLDSLAQRQDSSVNALTRKRPNARKRPTTNATPTVTTPTYAPPASLSAGTPPLPKGFPISPPNPVPANPLNALIVGDSTAFSASLAVWNYAYSWGVQLENGSRIGCGIAPGVGAGPGDQAPVSYGQCWNWPQLWSNIVAAQRPDVSLLMVGRWEVVDRKVGKTVMHIGQPAYDQLLKSQFEKAVSILGSQGGKVALTTAPCFQRPEHPDGSRWPQDDCRRVQAFNRIIWSVAEEHPSNVVVLDLYQFFSPDGRWHLDIDGHQVRDPDGLHYNIYGGQWLAPVFLGGLRTLMGMPVLPVPQPQVHLTAQTGG